ncbi:molybdenum ABC transporter ModA, periplasmic [Nocardioides flavus (ex Wang et al. 2016)]|uniref:Molybdenum ABC transporter ModA, periplasmic n=1 Tax=Nocardioides flavus (ex Wang et al. 2016) TaxID=2058780 RepID=A0ABQ3HPX0_9ACTN|nr:molybdate ABC transporter substrate-binding protein [Nocardioides flavus (ex Wang et al. 2016)]GHE17910.1 molybdenum ABC transporter ModA, periplasmic [Nocardioides flavus (ex Wang et al. 2016)]
MRRLAALALVLPLAACGGDDEERTLTVLAAASLSETFTELAAVFEEEHPGVEVEVVLGSSTTLAEQAVDGAPGDVLATADETSMALAEDGNALAQAADAFASNRITLVTPPDNPAGLQSWADLDDPGVDYVVCAATAPCGAVAAAALTEEGVTAAPASEEVDVKAVLARVVQGEADAGLVYRTDAVAVDDDVEQIPVTDEDASAYATTYFIAPLAGDDAERADLAAEFVTLVRSDEALEIFTEAGFGGIVRE